MNMYNIYKHQQIRSTCIYIYSFIYEWCDSKGKCCISNYLCHPPQEMGFLRSLISAPQVSQSRHWDCCHKGRVPSKQHLNSTETEAHPRLAAWPSRLLIFWVLRWDSSFFTFKWLKIIAAGILLFLKLGMGRLTTSHQNELSLKYNIFKVTYTSLSE